MKVSLVESSGDVRISRTRQHLGERLHSIIMRGHGLRERDFAHACVDRIMPALNAARAHVEPIPKRCSNCNPGMGRMEIALIVGAEGEYFF